MADTFNTLLLLALPASGKSEVRNYLTHRSPEQFHMGPTVQLDDYPYVHLQIRVDEEMEKMGLARPFHKHDGGPFGDPHEWGGLIQLLNDDYDELLSGKAEMPENAMKRLLERFDAASVRAGGKAKFADMPAETIDKLVEILEPEAKKLFEDKAAMIPESLDGKTIVIEYARGGPADKGMPLPEGYGYMGSLPQMSPAILSRAVILYIWVTPEESRRKNRARARPDGQGSILFHGTPEEVMFNEYGCDDMEYLLGKANKPDTIPITSEGQSFDIPLARFDNRTDLTTFLRADPTEWSQEDQDKLHGGIKEACDKLWAAWSNK